MPITIIMPIHDGETTLEGVFRRLDAQRHKELVDRIILIDDASRDSTPTILRDYAARSPYRVDIVTHAESHGLAASYNEGIRLCVSEYFLLMHDDVEISGDEAFPKMLAPFAVDPRTVVTYPTVIHPLAVWRTYGFWQKVLFSRWIGRPVRFMAGKFDCFDKKLLLERVGPFDAKTYRTAGEDSDMKLRVSAAGCVMRLADVEVAHVHSRSNDYSWRKLIGKEAQLAEASGACLRRWPLAHLRPSSVLLFFRPLLVLGLVIPVSRPLALLLLVAYSFAYTRLVYAEVRHDPRLFVLPFFNVWLLLVSTWFFLTGFVTGRQRL